MTKTYTMPTWEEFWTSYRDAAMQVSEVDYKAIREALAVEGTAKSAPTLSADALREVLAAASAFVEHYGLSDSDLAGRLTRALDAIAPTVEKISDEKLDFLMTRSLEIINRRFEKGDKDGEMLRFAIGWLYDPELGDAEEVKQPESERLVGAARGEGTMSAHNLRCRMTGKVCGVSWLPNESNIEGDVNCTCGETCMSFGEEQKERAPVIDWGRDVGREAWADVGGGEEKPVRAVDPEPVADHPRCGNCKFFNDRMLDNELGDCRRYPVPHNLTKHARNWCGEWRAK